MTPEVFECVQELRKQRDRPHDDLAFVSRYNRPWKDWRTAFQNAREKAGLSDVHFHDLRHTFASLLAMNNVNSKALSELLGHRDLTMTARYSHLSDGYNREAVSLLPRLRTEAADGESLQNPLREVKAKVVSLRK